MAVDVLLTLLGLGILLVGGDVVVRGAASLAARLGVSPLAIGLTVVAFGTSAPELAVNVTAAIRGSTDLSFGNIFGSNMANIGLIVSVTALVGPLKIQNVVIQREVPMMLLATMVAVVLACDGVFGNGVSAISRGDGVVLLLVFTVFGYYTLRDLIRQRGGDLPGAFSAGSEVEALPAHSVGMASLLTLLGLAMLTAGGAVTVAGAENVARAMGVSEAIIGLTLVAVGTSLPELVASITASLRGHPDMAIGNVVGSNIFNLLLVLATTGMIHDVPVPEGGLWDLVVVVALSALLWLQSASRDRTIIRTEAALLLVLYLGYMTTRVLL